MHKRNIMRVELNAQAMKMFETLGDRHGMTQLAMMSRLIEFFSKQRNAVQTGMIGNYPPDMQAKVSRMILDDLISKK